MMATRSCWMLATALCGVALAAPLAVARDLTIALPANVNTLDPDKTNTVATDLSVISHLYTPLVDRGPDMQLRAGLATSWVATDEHTWRFTLRDDVSFLDGEKLDAAAVKWNIERVLDPKTGARNKPWFASIQEVRVVDPTTIDVVSKAAYPDLPAQMAMFFLLPPQWAAANNPSVSALGSGPYSLVSFTSGNSVVLKARPDYWGTKPAFDTVTFRIMPEDSSRIAAVMAGDADLITVFPPSEIKRINASGRANAASVASTRAMFVKLNTEKPPFKDNPKLWLALNMAVDRQAIVDSLWDGLGQLENCQILSPAYFGYNPALKPIPYDPARAKALLAEAGFPNGLSFEMEVPTGRYLQASDIAQVVASQLGEIGVQVSLKEMEFGRFMNGLITTHSMGNAAYMGLAWPTLDAGGLLAFWETGNEEAYYSDAGFDRLAGAAHSTIDPAKRSELYAELTKNFCAAPPAILMFFQPLTYAERKGIKWQARGDDWVRAMDVVPQ